MSSIYTQHNNSVVLLPVFIMAVDDDAPQEAQASEQKVRGGFYNALVDTGATVSCVTRDVVERLSLKPMGKINIMGVAGMAPHNTYLFRVGFPIGPMAARGVEMSGNMQINPQIIRGPEIPPSTTFGLLMGMDLISSGVLVVQGNGQASFSF